MASWEARIRILSDPVMNKNLNEVARGPDACGRRLAKMLVALSFAMFACFIYLLISGRMSAMTVLILVPTVFAVIGGFAPEMGVPELATFCLGAGQRLVRPHR